MINQTIEMETVDNIIILIKRKKTLQAVYSSCQQDVSSGGVVLSGQTQRLEGTVSPTETGFSWHLLMGTL